MKIIKFFSNSDRILKRIIIISTDIIICIFSVILSFYLRIGSLKNYFDGIILVTIFSILLLYLFKYFKIYTVIIKYLKLNVAIDLLKGVFVYCLFLTLILYILNFPNVPRSIPFIHSCILFILMLSYRIFISFIENSTIMNEANNVTKNNILIYGFTDQGRQLLSILLEDKFNRVLGFVDEDSKLRNYSVNGVQILSETDAGKILAEKKINIVVLALTKNQIEYKRKKIDELLKYNIKIVEAPDLKDLEMKSFRNTFKNISIEDLLNRQEIKFENTLTNKFLNNEVVFISGAGGSIGSKISEEICSLKIKQLILLDNSEFNLYSLQNKLEKLNIINKKQIIPILGSILDKNRLRKIFKKYVPTIVFHSAAYKHVPIVEQNIVEGIENNIFGTLNLVEISQSQRVKKFILISTDKAVRPTNVMGASKRVSEIILQAHNYRFKKTIFSMVRFGNVLGSSGSVVPLFWNQIESGGPITITHPTISRFFMTDKEAARLVIQSSALSKGGDVFVLDMGELVKIKDLAIKMVILSGKTIKNKKNPSGDILIKYIGLRPGEKLYEEVLLGNNPQKTQNARILKANEKFVKYDELHAQLKKLRESMKDNDVKEIKNILNRLVLDYSPNINNVDWLEY